MMTEGEKKRFLKKLAKHAAEAAVIAFAAGTAGPLGIAAAITIIDTVKHTKD